MPLENRPTKAPPANKSAKAMLTHLLMERERKDLKEEKVRFLEKLRAIYANQNADNLTQRLSEQYEQVCHSVAGIVLRSRKISYLMTRDVMTPIDISEVCRATTSTVRNLVRELAKPVLVKLDPKLRPDLPVKRITESLSRLIETELQTLPGRITTSITPNPRTRSSVIPQNSTDLRILFLAANPASTSRLQLDEEIREIDQRLKKGSHRDAIKFDAAWAARIEDVFDALSLYRPKIVHFCGHGSHSGGIALVDGASHQQHHILSSSHLLELFTCFAGDIEAVVLNSCESAVHAEVLSSIISCCIGYGTKVNDPTATAFAGQFYSALGHGRTILEAFDQARALLVVKNCTALPAIFFKPGFDPSKHKFIFAKQEVDYTSLRTTLGNFKQEHFGRPARERITSLNDLIYALKKIEVTSDPYDQLLTILRKLEKGMETIINSSKNATTEMKGIQDRWSTFLSQEALSRMAAFGDISLSTLNSLISFPALLKSVTGGMILEKIKLKEPKMTSRDYFDLVDTIASTCTQFAATSVSEISTKAIHFDKIIECLPSDIEPTTERSNWQWP